MRFLVILFFAIVAVATAVEPGEKSEPAQQSCEPGKPFMNYCNRCICEQDGTPGPCTRMYCDRKLWNRNGTMKELLSVILVDDEWEDRPDYEKEENSGDARDDEEEERLDDESRERLVQKRQVCVPGTTYRNYCNTCTCNEDGSSSKCTKMRCGNGEFERNGQRPYVHYDLHLRKSPTGSKSNRDGSYVDNGPETRDLARAEMAVEQIRNFANMGCEPGKRFMHYCNSCRCSKSGIGARCTTKACPADADKRDGSLRADASESSTATPKQPQNGSLSRRKRDFDSIDFATLKCEPGKSFKHYCNTCTCSLTGVGAGCTYAACPPDLYNLDGSLKTTTTEESDNIDFATIKCQAEKEFKHFCNTCRCSRSGVGAACTYKECAPGVYYRNGTRKAAPLQRERCTAKWCDPEVYNQDGTFKVPITVGNFNFPAIKCEARKKFFYHCNRCQCSETGVGATCTNKACPFGVYNIDGSLKARENHLIFEGMTCEPGQRFPDYCNTCSCSLTGVGASCTNRICPYELYNRNGSFKTITRQNSDDDFAHMRCSPNEFFKHYCKDCWCSATGIGASCSDNACTPGEYYRDGTPKVRRDPAYFRYDLD
ncbi:uncharacterized protein [Venturia canescens]|uniref:uncharacterized protein isoform X2 n=1 Tax=Venturia canescens TaxID=32260 RepID=UPI001C9D103E|nr:uncharacterized protein LOC122417395 isoform X2 [Venturia canescens]